MHVASTGAGHGGDALDWVAAAIADVCGIDVDVIRPDTPLAAIGVDRLAVYCVADALDARLASAGLEPFDDRAIDAAVTVADLMAPLAAARPEPSQLEPSQPGPSQPVSGELGSDRPQDGVAS
jgi:hypothetical protein